MAAGWRREAIGGRKNSCSDVFLMPAASILMPAQAAVAGIEPASRRLTVAFPYQHRTHRIERLKEEG